MPSHCECSERRRVLDRSARVQWIAPSSTPRRIRHGCCHRKKGENEMMMMLRRRRRRRRRQGRRRRRSGSGRRRRMKRLQRPPPPMRPLRPPQVAPGPLQSPMTAARTQQPTGRLQPGRVRVGGAAQRMRETQGVSTPRAPAFHHWVPQPGELLRGRGQSHAHGGRRCC